MIGMGLRHESRLAESNLGDRGHLAMRTVEVAW